MMKMPLPMAEAGDAERSHVSSSTPPQVCVRQQMNVCRFGHYIYLSIYLFSLSLSLSLSPSPPPSLSLCLCVRVCTCVLSLSLSLTNQTCTHTHQTRSRARARSLSQDREYVAAVFKTGICSPLIDAASAGDSGFS